MCPEDKEKDDDVEDPKPTKPTTAPSEPLPLDPTLPGDVDNPGKTGG